MPKLDLDAFPLVNTTNYPPPFHEQVAGRWSRKLARQAGITDFGVNLITLEPGAWSSQRHWHEGEDEFAVLLAGEAVLVENAGRTLLRAGDCAAFPKGSGDGHHLLNESNALCTFLVFGCAPGSDCHYSDVDLHLDLKLGGYRHKDATPY